MNRYFVTVYARSADDLRKLQKHELDLFAQTARQDAKKKDFGFSIEGLIATGDIETLIKEGYRVLVEDTMEARTQAAQSTIEFSDWLGAQQQNMALDSAVRK
jgi:hypothetical protein